MSVFVFQMQTTPQIALRDLKNTDTHAHTEYNPDLKCNLLSVDTKYVRLKFTTVNVLQCVK